METTLADIARACSGGDLDNPTISLEKRSEGFTDPDNRVSIQLDGIAVSVQPATSVVNNSVQTARSANFATYNLHSSRDTLVITDIYQDHFQPVFVFRPKLLDEF